MKNSPPVDQLGPLGGREARKVCRTGSWGAFRANSVVSHAATLRNDGQLWLPQAICHRFEFDGQELEFDVDKNKIEKGRG